MPKKEGCQTGVGRTRSRVGAGQEDGKSKARAEQKPERGRSMVELESSRAGVGKEQESSKAGVANMPNFTQIIQKHRSY